MITHLHYNIREIPDLTKFKNKLLLYTRNDQVIIQTCQRLEIYSGNGEINASTALHLFRLVCGLESVFIGDTAIKTQVKNAYLESAKKNKLSKGMHKLFQWAFHVGKLVRTNTDISIGAVSYPQTVIHKLKAGNPSLSGLTVTLVGINDITCNLLKWLSVAGVLKLNLVNRSFDKAIGLAETYGVFPFRLDELSELVEQSDVIILCTCSPEYLLKTSQIPAGKKLCIFDLSWPQNADPDIFKQELVQYYTLDNIEQSIRQNLTKRMDSIHQAEMIIEKELKRLIDWQECQEIAIPAYLMY
jgi:glutamyl-tRNA reductase